MTNLFLVFDPKSSIFSIQFNWFSLFCVIPFLPGNFWSIKSIFLSDIFFMLKILDKEFTLPMMKLKSPGMSHFFVAIFLFVVLNNFLGLFPYIFTASSHLSLTFIMALGIWMGYMIFYITKNMNSFLSHLVPLGTPYILMPFMVLIELVSNVIRPLTLSVRLAANMVAGHLLMVLISTPLVSVSYIIFVIIVVGLLLLIILEVGVSFIQAYVFSTLMSLYIIEVNSPNLY